jgi:hypothetical protein
MKLTYSKTDKKIGIDGEFIQIDNIQFDPEVKTIQWYDTHGEIEFINPQEKNNQKFEDIAYINSLVELWHSEKVISKQPPVNQSKTFECDNQKLLDKLNSNTDYNLGKNLFVYIHIPKAAGTFIKNLISIQEETSDVFDPLTEVQGLSIPAKNAPTIEFLKQVLPAAQSDKIKFFVIVRNPYDRVYSMWKWSRQNGSIGCFDFPAVPPTFEEFVVLLGQGDYDIFYFMQSQLNYIKGENIDNLELFKFEDMGSVKDFLQNCNVSWSEKKLNHIPGPSYKDVYTPEMVEIVKTKYKDEFEVLGYSTEL